LPQQQEWFGIPAHTRPAAVTFQGGSSVARRMAGLVDALRAASAVKQELKVVWADESQTPDSARFGLRLVEDSVYGVMSYVDFLCKLHSKIQQK
jgi:hypothetical protein